MAAPRKPRAETEEDLRSATVNEALDELSRTFVAELRERAPLWTEAECQRLYRVVGIAYRRAYEKSHPIFAAYKDLFRTIRTIRSLAEDPENAALGGYGREMLDALVQHALPLEASLFSAQLFSRFLISNGLDPGLSTERQWFIFGADGLYDLPFGEAKPWGLERSPTARELALVALVAGDFPVMSVGTNGDTPARVIKRMTAIMATERRRVWLLLTSGEASGPPGREDQFDDEEGGLWVSRNFAVCLPYTSPREALSLGSWRSSPHTRSEASQSLPWSTLAVSARPSPGPRWLT